MVEPTNTVQDIAGKPLDELTEDELASLSEVVETRRKNLRDALEKEHFSILATAANKMVEALGLEKMPKITLTPDDAGEYEVSLASVVAVKSTEKRARATPDTSGGAITIKKIGVAKGGIAHFKSKGKAYKKIQDLVKALKQPDGKPEADRCWDITKSVGISASDIIIKYHAEEVTLVYQDGKEQLVKDAVDEMQKARAAA